MPLPSITTTPWPPPEWAPAAAEIHRAATWYEGDPEQLATLYGTGSERNRPSERSRGMVTRVKELFWSRPVTDSQTVRMHLPAAGDVAMVAADMLFGEEPTLTIPEAHAELDDDGEPIEPTGDTADAIVAQDRLAELVELDGITSTLIDAAEFASGLGAVYLRPTWDASVADHPMLTIVNADHAVPEYQFGRLTAVTFWSVVFRTAAGETWRHLERYDRGRIEHGLYIGSVQELGMRVDLREHQSTAALIGENGTDDDGNVRMPECLRDVLAVRCIENATNRKRQPYGRSDTAGLESEMNALDEAWSSWMRDIRLGKARIMVPDQFLDRGGRGQGSTFDVDREVFSPLEVEPSQMTNAGIQLIQPDIRTEAHANTVTELYLSIVRSAGYDPQSFGMGGDNGQATATEVRAKDGRSMRTNSRKQRRWARAIGDLGEMLLGLDAELYGWEGKAFRPTCTFVDPTEADVRERASTLNLVNLAQAASTAERVRILHPDWDEPQVKTEADLIAAELGIGATDDPTGGFPL